MAENAGVIVVDTGVWADWFNGVDTRQTARLEQALADDAVGVTSLILTEVLQGFRTDPGFESARQFLGRLADVRLTPEGYVDAARLYRSLRRRGVTIESTIDVLIAQTCIAAEAELLFADRDFALIARHSALKLSAV